MKKLWVFLLIIGVLAGVRWGYSAYLNVTSVDKITRIVEKHEEQLLASALAELESAGEAEDIRLLGIKQVSYLEGDGRETERKTVPIVKYLTGYGGFASQTFYCGFYYSSLNKPLGFAGEVMELTDEITGFQCQMEGDNWYVTEKIADYWYYYEMHY